MCFLQAGWGESEVHGGMFEYKRVGGEQNREMNLEAWFGTMRRMATVCKSISVV